MAGINRASWLAQRAAAEERENVIAELDTRPTVVSQPSNVSQPAAYSGELTNWSAEITLRLPFVM
jgi:hypothetical protein